VITGPAEVRLKEDGQLRDIRVPEGEVWRFTIPPGVTHAYRNPGPGTIFMIGFNSELHDPGKPDAERDEIF
jgi:mannose-6-phosphate isomerase-like protein (cupin superfamily)